MPSLAYTPARSNTRAFAAASYLGRQSARQYCYLDYGVSFGAGPVDSKFTCFVIIRNDDFGYHISVYGSRKVFSAYSEVKRKLDGGFADIVGHGGGLRFGSGL